MHSMKRGHRAALPGVVAQGRDLVVVEAREGDVLSLGAGEPGGARRVDARRGRGRDRRAG